MNKILRKLAGVFGASPIPQAGLNAQLMMDKYLLGSLIHQQHNKYPRTMYKPVLVGGADAKYVRIGYGFLRQTGEQPVLLRNKPFCHVVKAGFKKSLIRIHGLELLVSNEYIKQHEGITRRV